MSIGTAESVRECEIDIHAVEKITKAITVTLGQVENANAFATMALNLRMTTYDLRQPHVAPLLTRGGQPVKAAVGTNL